MTWIRRIAITVACSVPIVTIVCIGLALIGPTCGNSSVQRVDGDFNAIGSALKAYGMSGGQYPATEQGLRALVERPSLQPPPKKWTQTMDSHPLDPWKNYYQYRRLPDDDSRGFELRSAGPDGIDGTTDDLSSLDPVE